MDNRLFVTPIDPDRLWREAEEKAVCTCGLIAVGYRASRAVSHVERCPVTEVYRMLVLAASARAAR